MTESLQKERFAAIFLDYKLGDSNGLEILRGLIKEYPSLPVIMITAHGSISLALEAVHTGASGFITKPFFDNKVQMEIERSLRNRTKSSDGVNNLVNSSGIIGQSPAVARIHHQIHKMKDVETTVLIFGESGTGKELIAKALHFLSKRNNGKFEAINCAAIPETLLEAELFGYKKGAFTDAKSDRKGMFETCAQGTLFLDEIGEMPLSLQSKLLRVLQEKEVTPLGSSTSIAVATRVVAATNRNLKWLVNEGKFRKDLYYRLSILQIEAPPLRERLEDIPELTSYFVSCISRNLGKKIGPISSELMARLLSHDWPGNIRELQNALERAIVLSDQGALSFSDIFSQSDEDSEDIGSAWNKPLTEAKDDFEKKYLEKLLMVTKGNVSQASRIAGRLRTDMYRLFNKYDLDPSPYKPS